MGKSKAVTKLEMFSVLAIFMFFDIFDKNRPLLTSTSRGELPVVQQWVTHLAEIPFFRVNRTQSLPRGSSLLWVHVNRPLATLLSELIYLWNKKIYYLRSIGAEL